MASALVLLAFPSVVIAQTLTLWTPQDPSPADRPTISGSAVAASGITSAQLSVTAADSGGVCDVTVLSTFDVLSQAGGFSVDPWPDGILADGKYCVRLDANGASRTIVVNKDSSSESLQVFVSPNPTTMPKPIVTGFAPSGSVHVAFAPVSASGDCGATQTEGDTTGGQFTHTAAVVLAHGGACTTFCVIASNATLTAQDRFVHCTAANAGNAPMSVSVGTTTTKEAMQVSGSTPLHATQVDIHVYAVDSARVCTLSEVGGGATTLQNAGGSQTYSGDIATPLPLGEYCVETVATQGLSVLATARTRAQVTLPVAPTGPTGTPAPSGPPASSGPSGPTNAEPPAEDIAEIVVSEDAGQMPETQEVSRVLGSGCNGAGMPSLLLLLLIYLPKRRLR